MDFKRAFLRLFGRKKKFRTRNEEKLDRYRKLVTTVERQLAKKEAMLRKNQEKLRRAEAKHFKHFDRLEKRMSYVRG